ncbi:FAD-dependent oxidoreductase [Sulfitobacter sp. F26204]|uniref:NAD(P)/FAD-dependent oxidoreductase n=1 Tax=Sulfitobacter sp. F26204 TaxID=2996014 RepID=UPI00225DFE3E|nr:FAD-dependent oxidoreductase [Sulfitobacter sp. F26204]MCX7558493.1 FAD-dependent oxidoreductase [Sulfitobacter sp. F26204]
MAIYDLTIRGAGIFGLAVAWVAVQRGARVQLIDPFGAGAGSSGGIVGALAPHVPERWNPKKAFQLESLLMADRFWAQIYAAGGVSPGYARNGRLQSIADEHALRLANERAQSAIPLWNNHATWQVLPAQSSGWQPRSTTGYLIHDSLSALIHPRKACQALVAALAAQDVTVLPEGTDHGQVLWATGVAGLEALTAGHTRSMGNGVKGQAALLKHDASGMPQLYAAGVHIIPHCDGTVAVGSTTERSYRSATTTDDSLNTVIKAARTAVPALQDAPVIERWASLRPRARSRAPMLGTWPGKTGHFIANGGYKIGFGMAPKVAEVMVDLMLEGHDTIPQGFRVEDNL